MYIVTLAPSIHHFLSLSFFIYFDRLFTKIARDETDWKKVGRVKGKRTLILRAVAFRRSSARRIASLWRIISNIYVSPLVSGNHQYVSVSDSYGRVRDQRRLRPWATVSPRVCTPRGSGRSFANGTCTVIFLATEKIGDAGSPVDGGFVACLVRGTR